jgi:outer membrane receptor for ferrienterochelin and colicins
MAGYMMRNLLCASEGQTSFSPRRRLAARNRILFVFSVLLTAVALLVPRAFCQEQTSSDLSKLSIEDLMRIDVDTVYGASKFQQKITEAPASVTIVTDDQIRKYGYRTLAEVLRSVPGFFVDYDRNYSYAGVRGFSRPGDYSSGLLLLIDGHRTNDNVYDSPNFGTEFILDVDLIKRVEVIRGPASVLYGSNAFFGVINIITKRGRDIRGPEISADVGSLGTYRARATYGFDPLKGPEMLFSGTIYDSHGNQNLFFPEFDSPATNNGIAVDADRDMFHNFFASVQYHNFSIQAASDWREKGIPTASFGTVFNDPRSQTIDYSSYVDLKYEHKFASGWDVLGHVSYDRVGYDGIYVQDRAGTGVPPFVLNADHTRGIWWTVDASASSLLWKTNRITLGTETRINTKQNQSNNDLSPPLTYFNVQESSTIPAFYVQDEYSIKKNLIFSGGVRYDHYARFGGSANPRLALIYSPWARTSIKLLYGQAFRVPSPYELFLASNAALTPESIKTPEVALEHYFSQHLQLSASAYYNLIDKLIIQQTDPSGNIQFTNQGSVHTKGLDFELAGKWPSGWEGRIAYAVQDSRNENASDPVNNYPKHLPKVNFVAPLLRKRLFVSFEGQYMSNRHSLSGGNIGGYFVSNATLFSSDLFRGLSISLNAYNLLDRRYADPSGAGLTEDSVQQDGRTLRIKLTYRLPQKKQN